MTSFIKSIFSRKEEENLLDEDKIQKIRSEIDLQLEDTVVPSLEYPKGFDSEKETIVILDDNSGAVMLFDDTIKKVIEKIPKAKDIQFLKISTPQAVYILEEEIRAKRIRNLVGAVLDITLGGYAIINGVSTILDGIDAYEFIKKRFPNAETRFFTSHSMNEKNPEIYRFMEKYKKLTGHCIEETTYIKNPFSTNRLDMLIDIVGSVKCSMC